MKLAEIPIQSRLPGILLVLTSGCCWGFHGVLIKYAYTLGPSFLQVFLFEVLVSCLFFGFFAHRFFRGARPRGRRQWGTLSLIGISTVGVGNFLFLSFSYGPVAIASTLMFLYLPIVYFASILLRQINFSTVKFCAILLILAGAVMATEILKTYDSPGALMSVGFAVLAAMCYGVVFVVTPIVSEFTTWEFRSFAVSGMGLVGCLILLAAAPNLWNDLGDQWPKFLLFALFLGLVGQTLPVITLMKGLPLTGSSFGGVLASIELPIAIFSAAIVLGESLHFLKIIGVVCVVGGILIYNFSEDKPVVADAVV
jgi:drug/metabolite transporter (DMT)-like permease